MRHATLALVIALGWTVAARPAQVTGAQQAPAVAELVGQRLIVAIRGTSASAGLLRRIGQGQVGGVILFGGNVRNAPQVRALTRSLREAASAGGRPPPLVMVDQEGGLIRRLRWAPPVRSATELGRLTALSVRAAGRATAMALRDAGVNVDLAPVADVPGVAGSFIAAQRRAFSADPHRAATLTTAFAAGLADGGVLATAKHFPGLGRATVSTDAAAVTLTVSRAQLDADLEPYRALIAASVPIVMISNATYSALDAKPGAWSPAVETLLRRTLGFTGVTITDALEAVARTHARPVASVALLAAQAGVDLLLVTGSELESDAVYQRLLAAAGTGTLPAAGLERSYDRILALKARLS